MVALASVGPAPVCSWYFFSFALSSVPHSFGEPYSCMRYLPQQQLTLFYTFSGPNPLSQLLPVMRSKIGFVHLERHTPFQ